MTDDPRPSAAPFSQLAAVRLSRRQALLGAGAWLMADAALYPWGRTASASTISSLTFEEVDRSIGPNHRVPPGYQATVLIRWGDRVLPRAPAFDPARLTAAAQAGQFGTNNDFVAFMPLPRGTGRSDHGLLCVNHESSDGHMMWPGMASLSDAHDRLDRDQVEVEMAAHGHSVIEVRRTARGWEIVPVSAFARRLTAETPMRLSGPAAGHDRLRTSSDPAGTRVFGTINNCAGGKTPWGTVLIAEENFNDYFGGDPGETDQEDHHRRYGITGDPEYAWSRWIDRFSIENEPNEPNRFGWIVEFDPYDPLAEPVKRTALGRFKHEGAATWVNRDGRLVVYSGDDEAMQYIYRFVSRDRVIPGDPAANGDLLDHGILSVARFEADGSVGWLPLVFGQGPLNPSHGFHSQAEILIEARRAAELVGATPMDRPEDVEVNPGNGRVYAMLTNDKDERGQDETDAANPRGPNPFGHIVEMQPPGHGAAADHAADRFQWDIFLLGGDPDDPSSGARAHPATSSRGWLAAPDNCAFDPRGRLWIATDQGRTQDLTQSADGLYACDVDGAGRALTRMFFACPDGAEATGPEFTPDGRTLFVAVQHPGAGKDRSFAEPATRWPDFSPGVPPRSAVLAIIREDGGEIGL